MGDETEKPGVGLFSASLVTYVANIATILTRMSTNPKGYCNKRPSSLHEVRRRATRKDWIEH